MSAVIYIEGGGNRDENLARLFRRAWTRFFEGAGLAGRMPRVVRGGGRARTFDLFQTAVGNPRPGRIPILLVDSETEVPAGQSVWQHLHARDGWERPHGARDDQGFLMVQVMETWLLADRDALRRYFGARFRGNALPQWPDLEDVARRDVLDALDRATAACQPPYAKGTVSFELLERIDPAQVETECPHAGVLLNCLRTLRNEPGP